LLKKLERTLYKFRREVTFFPPDSPNKKMKVWAIADLHLSGAQPKPMSKFGANWAEHDKKIASAWLANVASDDLVIVAGDISWALKLEDALIDLEWLAQLPGQKVLIKGNHDFWWDSISKVRSTAPEGIAFIQNSAFRLNDVLVAGTRGWNLPSAITADIELSESDEQPRGWTEHDEKILAREVGRLAMSIEAAKKLSDENSTLIVVMHFPPLYRDMLESPFTNLIDSYNPNIVVYGHLHGLSRSVAYEGKRGDTFYRLVSVDQIGFQPVLISQHFKVCRNLIEPSLNR